MAGLKKEIWTGEVVRQMTYTGDFLTAVPDASKYADNDVIHINALGVKPDVLINNTTYPIPSMDTDDEDITISLDKFQTKRTTITDDEIEYITYDKVGEYVKSHAEALEESTSSKAAHAIAPAADAALTPVVLTTGAENAAGHKALLVADLIALKKEFDDQKIPQNPAQRILVLCPQHIADLLAVNQAFQLQYQNITTGKVLNLFGFTIYEFADCPSYYLVGGTTWTKVAFGATEATSRVGSFAFYAPNVFKARGTVKFYRRNAENDPDNQETSFNYKLRFIAMPKKSEQIAAIVSPDA
jgi:hypothetical protein